MAGAASREDVVAAIDAAAHAASDARALPSYERAAVLQRIHDAAAARREELAVLLALEAGKPISRRASRSTACCSSSGTRQPRPCGSAAT
jgi:acyl-CoA reductase-like NAD-dependent aldehyde dehydrogenase